MEHLIANSGIHFIERIMEFNPEEPLILSSGKTLKYTFFEQEDALAGFVFDLVYHHSSGGCIPLDQIRSMEAYKRLPDGREDLDVMGLLQLSPEFDRTQFDCYPDGSPELININNLASYRLHGESAFSLLLNQWLPMPMFEIDMSGITSDYPLAWCRVRIEEIGEGRKKGFHKYRLLWAFDTDLGEDDLQRLRPFFFEWDPPTKNFVLCNRADELLSFMSTGGDFHAFSDYIRSLLGIPDSEFSSKYIAYYIYLVNFIRLGNGAPEITLHNQQRTIPVDMVLDIGNSRTCGVLFEHGDFTKAMMLGLRDMTHPEQMHVKSFDMRLVFRKADLGNAIVLDDPSMFRWKSFVRIGDEAKRLIYRSIEDEGLSQSKNNYSSPKRYIWDDKPSEDRWQFLNTIDDPFNVQVADNIYIPVLSDLFDAHGCFIRPDSLAYIDDEGDSNYSRSSLMTFVLIEIFQQAISQINSIQFREKHGDVDCRRVLRNIILTCPTAMPKNEQIKLRQFAQDAYDAISQCTNGLPAVNVLPTAESLRIGDGFDDGVRRMWSYDEASCCQLVYLYAEIAERYSGEIHRFFDLKGHVRPEDIEEGYEGKSLTIGSVDIGAGTTDVMVCSYQCIGEGQSQLTPTPLFWDSFYMAGDDILHNIVQNHVIEGEDKGLVNVGNITSAFRARLMQMSPSDMLKVEKWCTSSVYRTYIDNMIEMEKNSETDRLREKKRDFCSCIVRDFFGADSNMQGFRDRRCRVDFNTQISVPIAQFYLELLRTERPTRTYTYEELFPENKPAKYLLEYFEQHFGFKFQELEWRYDSNAIAKTVRDTMEGLLKQLSVVLYSHHCDILVLAGRPTSLNPITELFIKYLPISPDRLIRLNEYRVGNWYPFADGQGFFYDHKSVVAVGGMVGYMASTHGFNGMMLNFNKMIKTMRSTAKYMGIYNSRNMKVSTSLLTPDKTVGTTTIGVFPSFIGCKQFDTPIYLARPIYALYDKSSDKSHHGALRVTLSRNYYEDREQIFVDEVTDSMGNSLPKGSLELVQQSLVDDGSFWLDKGEFTLSL